jgi:hypothetical protein
MLRNGVPAKRRLPALAALIILLAMIGGVPNAFADDDDRDDDDGRTRSPDLIDFTTGTGTAQFGALTSTFNFEVTSGPLGEGAVGFATLTSAFGVRFSGPATCLRVDGNLAVFEVDSQDPADPRDVVVFVGDFGVAGVPQPDSFNFHFINGFADADCPTPSEREPEHSVVTGDIVVGDNLPPPRRRVGDDDDGDDDD